MNTSVTAYSQTDSEFFKYERNSRDNRRNSAEEECDQAVCDRAENIDRAGNEYCRILPCFVDFSFKAFHTGVIKIEHSKDHRRKDKNDNKEDAVRSVFFPDNFRC